MNRFIILFFTLLCFGCQDKQTLEENIDIVINLLAENQNQLKDLRINVLRFPSSTIEYEIRKKNSIGFSVIQTYPEKKILKEHGNNSINLKLLELISQINKADKKVVLLLDFQNDKPEIDYSMNEYRVKIKKVKNDKEPENMKCNLVTSDGKWCYMIIEVISNWR
jgi:hypothetical protein